MTDRHAASMAPLLKDHDDLPHGEYNRGRRLLQQWTALLLAPATFLVHLQVAYMLVPWACGNDGHVWVHVAGALSVLLSAAGALVAWRLWGATRRGAPSEGADLPSRARFVAVSGLVTSLAMTLVLVVQWVAVFVYSPCE